MLTIEEYIAKMKRADKLDEFDYVKISENMSSVMKYVMSYFNEYLTMETCDVEEIKHRHAADKLEQEAAERFPNSKSFVVEFYLSNKIRIDKLVDNWMKALQYLELYYSEDDFASLADEYCNSTKIAGVDMQVYKDSIKILMAEIKAYNTDKLDFSDMIHLDNNIISWIKDTYHTYGVNLIEFASNITYSFYKRYVKYEREQFSDRGYYINNYNHRYNENPFEIDRIYEQNKHKPFLENKRGELEMLMMYKWLFDDILDEEYWPEYVNLCVAQHRVNIVKSVNVLIPVTIAGLKYPEDAPSTTDIIITSDGMIKKPPTGSYVLRLELIESQTNVWQDSGEMSTLIALLEKNFKEYGLPDLLELSAPMKTASFDEEMFFNCCSLLEKKMKKHSHMKVAIINGPTNKRTKPSSYLGTVDDITTFKTKLRMRKIHISLSIDFTTLVPGRRGISYDQKGIFGALAEIKNSIVSISMTYNPPQPINRPKSKTLSDDTDVYYLNRFRYAAYEDIYSLLSAAFRDNQPRYFIPKGIHNDEELEQLVDNLLRSGYAFCSGGDQNDISTEH